MSTRKAKKPGSTSKIDVLHRTGDFTLADKITPTEGKSTESEKYAEPKSVIYPGPNLASVGYFDCGGDMVWLSYIPAEVEWDENEVNAAVERDIDDFFNAMNSHEWDDSHYWVTLPPDGSKLWVFYWYNASKSEYGWGAIHNGSYWKVMWNDGFVITLQKDKQWTQAVWEINDAAEIWLQVKNPKNTNGFTADDVLYGFFHFQMQDPLFGGDYEVP